MEKHIEIITKVTTEILTLLGISAEVEVIAHEDNAEIIVKSEETGLLIGYHGETLESLQLVISLAVAKQTGEFLHISLEVGDYKKNRTEWLHQTVADMKERALSEHQPVTLPHLKAWERRVVHVLLQDDTDVITESIGEGRDRVLQIRPRD